MIKKKKFNTLLVVMPGLNKNQYITRVMPEKDNYKELHK